MIPLSEIFVPATETEQPVRLFVLTQAEFGTWLSLQSDTTKRWVQDNHFSAKAGELLKVANAEGALSTAVYGLGEGKDPWAAARIPTLLPPEHVYSLAGFKDAGQANWLALTWGLSLYRYDFYRDMSGKAGLFPRLVWPEYAEKAAVESLLHSIFLARDLINTPPNALGPAELANAAKELALSYGARCNVLVGNSLLEEGYTAVHAVGRGSPRLPRVIDIRFGEEGMPKVTLVGKGVCFDSGGINLKPGSAMQHMKKDMGGAAIALGVARAVMQARLPVRLRVLIPAVENSISGEAYRPSDVIQTKKGISVEVANTDAEGRLILADALTEAAKEQPDLLIDFATLTGAARVALGPDLPAFFTRDSRMAAEIVSTGEALNDPCWRMPLWSPYMHYLDSKVADISNSSSSSMGGSITAALFLSQFVEQQTPWMHFDVYAWNEGARPGRPEGGEGQLIRLVYAFLEKRYSKKRPKDLPLPAETEEEEDGGDS